MSVVDTTIPETMRAIVCHGIEDYRSETVATMPNAELLPGQLLVKVTRCGLCAGDAKCYKGAPAFWGSDTRPKFVQTPVIPGHEFVGTVVAMGENADKLHKVSIGDQVTCEQVVPCNNCLYCKKGRRWLCDPHDLFGFHKNVNGGVCEYMIFPANGIVYKIPSFVQPAESVYVEPLSCSVHGVERGNIQFGEFVVVSGCGPIGLGMVSAAKMRAPGRLIALDCNDDRLDIARACGADVVLNPMKEDVVKTIRNMTGGYGCDVYLEASGNPASVKQGINACRKDAKFVEFSVFKEPTTIDWTLIGDTKELTIKGGHCSGDNGYKVAIEMLSSRRLPVERIVTHALPLDDTVTGLNMVDAGAAGNSVKVTIDPTVCP